MSAGSQLAGSADSVIQIGDHHCIVLMTGMGPRAARTQLSALLDRAERPELVLSIGLAGGLQTDLSFGEARLIEHVLCKIDERSQATTLIAANLERLSSNLRERMDVCNLVTLKRPALTVEAKRSLAGQTAAAMCDMETYAVADECRRRQLPWVGARIVSDAVGDTIPAWIVTLPRLIEQKQYLPMLGRIATHPQDLPCLIRLALRMQRLKPKLTQLTLDLVTHVLRT